MVVVNYAPNQGQCYVTPSFSGLRGKSWRLSDLMNDVQYQREGTAMTEQGLYLDLPPWGYHAFALEAGR
jgi:hypothetical protein